MTAQQLETRRRRAKEAPMVIQQIEDGFLVYSAADPTKTYQVTDDGDHVNCTCPDFETHKADPEWCCKHILAVQEVQRRPRETAPEPEAEPAEGQPGEPPEQEPRPARPARTRRRRENGNGEAHMLIKRSISPDGRIDAVSVEFATPVNGSPASEIKAQALRTLKLQNEIASAFLNLNGNGKRRKYSEPDSGNEPPQAPTDGQPVAARLIDIGKSDGRYGERLFISVQANGKRLRLYGSPGQLAAYIGFAGESVEADELAPGLRLNIPCRVVLKENDNGYLTVTKVFRAGLPPQRGRGRWQSQRV